MTSFTIATKTIKYLGINLTQEVKDPNSENYETLMSLKEMQIKGKAPCAHREKSNGAENVGTSKGYWQTQGKIPIESPRPFFCISRTSNPKIYTEPQIPQIAKTSLRKNCKAGGTTRPDYKPYYKALLSKQSDTGIKTDKYVSRTELRAQKQTQTCTNNIRQGSQEHLMRKDSLFNRWCCGVPAVVQQKQI